MLTVESCSHPKSQSQECSLKNPFVRNSKQFPYCCAAYTCLKQNGESLHCTSISGNLCRISLDKIRPAPDSVFKELVLH
ncbi:hypothetical protein V5799_012479 [Amblyomma americanum]|uniref:Uncharacterized protein n=1 Tax=Amblyomma americanum TaxID=6943 RepID=A0AAQ4EDY0_AMBAM